MKFVLLPLAACFLLTQCSLFTAGTNHGIDENPFDVLERQSATWKAKSPKRVSVPILRARSLERRWGKPDLLVGPDGSYALRYANPSNRAIAVLIYGSPSTFLPAGITPPPYTEVRRDKRGKIHANEVPQQWRQAEIEGKTVRYCISEETDGSHPNQFATETFRLTDKKGRSGSYRVRVGSGRDGTSNDVRKLLETVKF